MISVRKNFDRCYEVMNGHARLKVSIEVNGKAEVMDVETGKTLFVHEIDGNLVALSEDAQVILEDQVSSVKSQIQSRLLRRMRTEKQFKEKRQRREKRVHKHIDCPRCQLTT